MAAYRLYFFGKGRDDAVRGHIARGEDLNCEDDAQAIRGAERLRAGAYVELWERGRLVKVFEPE